MSAPSPGTRRVYLTGRLVNRQITMEEATELFTIMNREADRLRKQVMSASRSVQEVETPPTPGLPMPPPPPGWSPPKGVGLDNLDEILLYGGPMLGILAALMKRSGLDLLGGASPPSATAKPRTTPAKSSSQSG